MATSTFKMSGKDNIVMGDKVSDEALAEHYRKAATQWAAKENKTIPNLDDRAIAQLVRSIEGPANKDNNLKRIWVIVNYQNEASLLDDVLDVTTSVRERLSSVPQSRAAYDIGARLNRKIVNVFVASADANETLAGSALQIGDGLYREPGLEVLDWPEPRSRKENLPAGSNQPTDYWKVTPASGRVMTGSYYADMFFGTEPGSVNERLRNILLAGTGANAKLTDDHKNEIRELVAKQTTAGKVPLDLEAVINDDQDAIGSLKKWNNTRARVAVGKLRLGVLFARQRFKLEKAGVVIKYTDGNDVDAAARRSDPIRMIFKFKNAKTGEIEDTQPSPVGITTFTRYDVDTAVNSVNTPAAKAAGILMVRLADLKKTLDKGADDTPEADVSAIKTTDDFFERLMEIVPYLQSTDRRKELRDSLRNLKDEREKRSRIRLLGDLTWLCGEVMPEFDVQYQLIKDADNAKENEDAAAQLRARGRNPNAKEFDVKTVG